MQKLRKKLEDLRINFYDKNGTNCFRKNEAVSNEKKIYKRNFVN